MNKHELAKKYMQNLESDDAYNQERIKEHEYMAKYIKKFEKLEKDISAYFDDETNSMTKIKLQEKLERINKKRKVYWE